MATFRVVRETLVPVTTYERREEVIVETDDWLEAAIAYGDALPRQRHAFGVTVRTEGIHHTHNVVADIKINGGRGRGCVQCGAPDNGCHKIQAPCGYDFEGKTVRTLMDERRASLAGAETHQEH